jgi:hypothetical protein
MKASTREWIAKAEEDFAAAEALARLRKKPLWAAFRPALKRLTDSAILPRYPGNFFTKAEAQRALKTCRLFVKKHVYHLD